jgi:uncharacterized protein (DUF2237 family)
MLNRHKLAMNFNCLLSAHPALSKAIHHNSLAEPVQLAGPVNHAAAPQHSCKQQIIAFVKLSHSCTQLLLMLWLKGCCHTLQYDTGAHQTCMHTSMAAKATQTRYVDGHQLSYNAGMACPPSLNLFQAGCHQQHAARRQHAESLAPSITVALEHHASPGRPCSPSMQQAA